MITCTVIYTITLVYYWSIFFAVYIYKTVDLEEKVPSWDHKVNKLVESDVDINTINAFFFRDNWMNKTSISFCSKYACLVSNTRKAILDKIKEDPSNLFIFLNKSVIVWAILVYVTNKE